MEGVSLKGNIPAIRLYLAANGPDGGIADQRDSNSNSSESIGDLDTWLLATRQGASISSGPKEKLKDALASLNFLVAEESMQAFTEVMQHPSNSSINVSQHTERIPSVLLQNKTNSGMFISNYLCLIILLPVLRLL